MALRDTAIAWQPQAQGLLRIVVGYLFLSHGTAKLFGIPHVAMFDNLQLVLRAKGGPSLPSALDRLRTDAELLDILAHIGSTHSPVVRWVDDFRAAVEHLVE